LHATFSFTLPPTSLFDDVVDEHGRQCGEPWRQVAAM
jgi:hypothetical protein